MTPLHYNSERPWERQPCDGDDRDWLAFVEYRAQPRDRRSIETLGCVYDVDLQGPNPYRIENLIVVRDRDAWDERVSVYDEWIRTPEGRLELAQELVAQLLVDHTTRTRPAKLQDVTALLRAVALLSPPVPGEAPTEAGAALDTLMRRLELLRGG